MIRPAIVAAIARAEMRLTRRLVRFWVFAVIGGLLAVGYYAQFAFIYGFFSWASASAATANPRYFVATIAGVFLLVFGIGLVFLGYDVRGRDTRERMAEVLDALPCSNLELLLGRFIGVLVPSWLALLAITLLIQIIGFIFEMTVEPWSLITMLVFMAVPAFCLTLAGIYFLSVLLQRRLVAAPILIGILMLPIAVSALLPIWVLPLIDFNGAWLLPWPSDIVPRIIDLRSAAHRASLLLGAFGLLWLAAAVHPRRDDAPRGRTAALGLVMVLVAAAVPVILVLENRAGLARRAAWKAVHERHRDDPAPDIEALSGRVIVDPGQQLDAAINVRFRAPQASALEEFLFTLNPGMQVATIRDDAGRDVAFEHVDGLLRVRPATPLPAGASESFDLTLSGTPDSWFPYLDEALDLMKQGGFDGQLVVLGRDPFVFHRRFVALLPGVRWLPSAGTDVAPTGSATRTPDFFDVDLTFEVPQGWLAAGPGRRQDGDGASAGRSAFRFAPPAPMPAVAFVAGPLESRSTEIEGVLLEALYHPKHQANFELFEEGAPFIRKWLEERLTEAREVGLPYPYDGLTLVEVPNGLRGYGGGWRMDTTLAQPAMILNRESGFPTAYYRKRFDDAERWQRFDGGIPEAMRWVLETFFENDINGGNPFSAASKDFFAFQTAGEGPIALPLDWVWHSLSTRLVTDKSNYFSVWFFDREFGQKFQQAGMATQGDDAYSSSYAESLIHLVTSRPQVWEAIEAVSLAQLDPWEDPEKAIKVLSLKGGAMAESMLDALGREKVGQLLGALRRRTAGGVYGREDLLAAAAEVGVDIERWLDVWIEQTSLPGFTLGEARIDRLPDEADGTPRYQALVTVRNDEAVPGLIVLEYSAGDEQSGRESGTSDPVEVSGSTAMEVGLVTSKPLTRLRVKPYLAQNRDPFSIILPSLDQERIVQAEPFTGARPADWTPPPSDAIVVDDLDAGFTVEDRAGRNLRVEGKAREVELDLGLPLYERSGGRVPSEWSRTNSSTAWGKYRRTAALIRKGSGDQFAVFTADIPRSGTWTLEYHLPTPRRADQDERGTWNLTLEDGSGSQALTFDADGADAGWNTLGTFEVAGGEVRIEVSDQTDGRVVVADAIRWTPGSSAEVARVGP